MCRSASADQPFDVGPAGLTSLSGTWTGTVEEKKTGSCNLALRNDKRFATSELAHKLRAEWLVEADGTFKMREFMDEESEPTEWSGVVESTLRVTGVVVSRANCAGSEHESHSNLAGRVVKGPQGPVLRLSGKQNACPDLGCTFDLGYVLTKQK